MQTQRAVYSTRAIRATVPEAPIVMSTVQILPVRLVNVSC
jgi:hypothetical protein